MHVLEKCQHLKCCRKPVLLITDSGSPEATIHHTFIAASWPCPAAQLKAVRLGNVLRIGKSLIFRKSCKEGNFNWNKNSLQTKCITFMTLFDLLFSGVWLQGKKHVMKNLTDCYLKTSWTLFGGLHFLGFSAGKKIHPSNLIQSEVDRTLRGLPHSSQHCPGFLVWAVSAWGLGTCYETLENQLVKVCFLGFFPA